MVQKSYHDELMTLVSIKQAVNAKDTDISKQSLEDFRNSATKMIDEFDSYRHNRSLASETFKYWDTFIVIVRQLRNTKDVF